MKNFITKIFVCGLMICCPLCTGLTKPVKAHAGHEHLPKSKTNKSVKKGLRSTLSSYLDLKYEIVIDGEHKGHFYLRKMKKNKEGMLFRLEQTFHLADGDLVDSKIRALYLSDDKTLRYHVNGEENDYEIWVDFQDLEGGDNSGVRITYSNDTENREITVENIIVRQVLETDDGSHGGGHGGDDNMHGGDDSMHGGDGSHDGMEMS
ncbi:MAG: hypothetical protein HRT47_06355 [Candidatus Caenarcaniphilales bacterium]|nr:hypothetical protein [Candidatus Caenarcaniphilales bacterium]